VRQCRTHRYFHFHFAVLLTAIVGFSAPTSLAADTTNNGSNKSSNPRQGKIAGAFYAKAKSLLKSGRPVILIVELHDKAAQDLSNVFRPGANSVDNEKMRAARAQSLQKIKAEFLRAIPLPHKSLLNDYSNLPMVLIQITSTDQLDAVLNEKIVKFVFEDQILYPNAQTPDINKE